MGGETSPSPTRAPRVPQMAATRREWFGEVDEPARRAHAEERLRHLHAPGAACASTLASEWGAWCRVRRQYLCRVRKVSQAALRSACSRHAPEQGHIYLLAGDVASHFRQRGQRLHGLAEIDEHAISMKSAIGHAAATESGVPLGGDKHTRSRDRRLVTHRSGQRRRWPLERTPRAASQVSVGVPPRPPSARARSRSPPSRGSHR